ncbi:hypothetical protein [Paraburkholderia sp. BCC1885]|uniref:hypothetical protein n=1 Tax=Paraburkholderia sp. BCC1885 TaxID=2562669 RepID=UPI00164302B9|nr:hypothetical protein [Paraburkholderia sp. BCC1885]
MRELRTLGSVRGVPSNGYLYRDRKIWAEKMLERAAKGDVEGNFRLHWLLFILLEDYFAVRRNWYLGPKQSFRKLRETTETHFSIFETALKPGASLDAVREVIDVTFEGV